MAEPTSDKHFETKFEYPLWKLIKQRAEQKDISYVQAAGEVTPEYEKGIRYRDKQFESSTIAKRVAELKVVRSKTIDEVLGGGK